jgi:hypothetical protein
VKEVKIMLRVQQGERDKHEQQRDGRRAPVGYKIGQWLCFVCGGRMPNDFHVCAKCGAGKWQLEKERELVAE